MLELKINLDNSKFKIKCPEYHYTMKQERLSISLSCNISSLSVFPNKVDVERVREQESAGARGGGGWVCLQVRQRKNTLLLTWLHMSGQNQVPGDSLRFLSIDKELDQLLQELVPIYDASIIGGGFSRYTTVLVCKF